MVTQFQDALAYLASRRDPSAPEYREACETVAGNLDQLPYRLFIHLPGGLTGNNDPVWDTVKAASESLCGCGNERVFEPRTMRQEFEQSSAEPIVLGMGDKLYVRPVGAPSSAAYVMFEVIDIGGAAAVSVLHDPMSTTFSLDLFSTKGFTLAQLADALSRQSSPAIFVRDLKHVKRVPIVAISAADQEAKTVTILLDAGHFQTV